MDISAHLRILDRERRYQDVSPAPGSEDCTWKSVQPRDVFRKVGSGRCPHESHVARVRSVL